MSNDDSKYGPHQLGFNSYQLIAKTTVQYPEDVALMYLALGVNDEAGEIAGKVKKYLRGDYDDKKGKEEILKWELALEIGDVLWYLAMLSDHLGIDFERVAVENIEKLQRRAENDTIKGNGDYR